MAVLILDDLYYTPDTWLKLAILTKELTIETGSPRNYSHCGNTIYIARITM